MLTFATAMDKLNGKKSRKLENNTYLEMIEPHTIGVRLHNTYVVKIHSDGRYTLNSGGWDTNTTKDRINSYSNVRIDQKKKKWFVFGKTPFTDGMVVNPDGSVDLGGVMGLGRLLPV